MFVLLRKREPIEELRYRDKLLNNPNKLLYQ